MRQRDGISRWICPFVTFFDEHVRTDCCNLSPLLYRLHWLWKTSRLWAERKPPGWSPMRSRSAWAQRRYVRKIVQIRFEFTLGRHLIDYRSSSRVPTLSSSSHPSPGGRKATRLFSACGRTHCWTRWSPTQRQQLCDCTPFFAALIWSVQSTRHTVRWMLSGPPCRRCLSRVKICTQQQGLHMGRTDTSIYLMFHMLRKNSLTYVRYSGENKQSRG